VAFLVVVVPTMVLLFSHQHRVMPTLSSLYYLAMVAVVATVVVVVSANQLGDLANPDDQQIRLVEDDRVAEYYKRNYTYPLENYTPNTPGWRKLMEERFKQVEELDDAGKRYEGTSKSNVVVHRRIVHFGRRNKN
jgi:hypothetical protein